VVDDFLEMFEIFLQVVDNLLDATYDECLMHPVHPQQHLPQRVAASEDEKRGHQHDDQDHDP
jgi:hypothetical protein